MTTPQAQIDWFLNRPLPDHRWVKDISDKEIDEALEELRPVFKVPMRRHQKIGFLLGLANPRLYFQYEMGLGKTGLSLELIAYLYRHGKLKKALVFVPMNELVDGWIEEIEKWGIDLPYTALRGSTEQRWETYEQVKEGLVLVSYPAMVHMTCVKVKKGRKTYMEPHPNRVQALCKGVDGAWFDEITKTKNHQSLTFRVANAISRHTSYSYGLAGRVFGRDPEAAWAQFYIIDRGDTFSRSIGFFRDVFFLKKKTFFGGPYSYEYTFDHRRDEDFSRHLAARSLRFAAEECDIDLPDSTNVTHKVDLPASSTKYYREALEEIRKAHGKLREVQHAFIRMRQISSGFLGFVDDDTGERAQIEFPKNPKLDLLMDLIDQMPDGRKCIIGVEFTWSGMAVSKALHKAKIRHGWLYGGTKDWPTMKGKFDNDPDFRCLIVQSKKGAYGLNLQSASYIFYYESPVSVLDRLQSEARAKRQGQKHHVFIYDLVCRNTADESILAFHRQGRNLFDALVKNPDEALAEK